MTNAFFSDLLSSISERGRTLLRRAGSSDGKQDASDLIELCEALLSGRGEASGTAMAREVLDRYHHLDAGRPALLLRSAGAQLRSRPRKAGAGDRDLARGADRTMTPATCISLPSRGGRNCSAGSTARRAATGELVPMRADLLGAMKGHKDLAALDRDVVHLLSSWFNRGFLVLRRIDWSTPANILEQIIRYEAVHEIRDWDDLRRRIDPVDRRCYAFFHPALPDAPLIFVEVALTEAIPGAIAPLLAEERQTGADRARPHRRVLFDLQHPARARRHFLRQLPDQAGGRGIAPRTAEARQFRDAVAGAGLHAMAEAGRGCSAHATKSGRCSKISTIPTGSRMPS